MSQKRTLPTKVGELLGSVRFWVITLAAVFAILSLQYPDAAWLEIVRNWLVLVFGAGTLDSFAVKFSHR